MNSLLSPGTGFIRPIRASFNPETGFVVVEINKNAYRYSNQDVHYLGRVFKPKDELHITIVSQDAAEIVRQKLEQHPEDLGRIQEIVDHTDWSFRKLEEYYHVEEPPDVETIIQMVEVPYLAEFFRDLAQITGGGYILPPTHVTLYMRGTEKGIALPTREIFNARVKAQIPLAELPFDYPGGETGATF